MPLHPSKSLHFDSWEKLLQWLPEASETQLMVVFVWSGDLKAPAGDAPLLTRVRKEAFEHLVRQTRERLKRFLGQRCQCRDLDLAEDVVQQVLIKLFLRAEQFDPKRSFWGWLYRIARNEYVDALRRIRPGDIGMGHADAAREDWEQSLARRATSATPEEVALQQEQQQRLDTAIAALPNLQRTVVRLKREGLKGKEIATRLGISQAYVSQLYHEAGEVLRETIEH